MSMNGFHNRKEIVMTEIGISPLFRYPDGFMVHMVGFCCCLKLLLPMGFIMPLPLITPLVFPIVLILLFSARLDIDEFKYRHIGVVNELDCLANERPLLGSSPKNPSSIEAIRSGKDRFKNSKFVP